MAATFAAGILLIGISASAQQGDAIAAAVHALGPEQLKSVRLVGLGRTFVVGQSPSPAEPWPALTLKRYDSTIDYETERMRVETVSEQGAVPPRGGGIAFNGEQRLIQFVVGTHAWNVAAAPAPRRGGAGPGEQPPEGQPGAAAERLQQIWLTPHGFLRAAIVNRATTRPVPGGTEVSFVHGAYKVVGIINRQNRVEHVHTWVDSPVLGDMLLEAHYIDYDQVAGGFSFPMRITQKQGGHPSLDLWLFSVEPNVTVDVTVPDTVRAAAEPAARVELQKIADGVYYVTGGSHHSVAVETQSYVVVVEAPLDEARSLAVLARIKETIPNKPIRFVVNTHHHFDHAGGLRTYVNEGATIVTHEMNRAYYEKAWAAPRTLHPDNLVRSGRVVNFQTFSDKHVFDDGGRTIEVHRLVGSPHDDGLAMVYLPLEKILIEADAYTPSAVEPASSPTGVNPSTCNLYQNIRRLKLDVGRIAPLEGPRLATMADLALACGHRGE